jgi:hypothetical protein
MPRVFYFPVFGFGERQDKMQRRVLIITTAADFAVTSFFARPAAGKPSGGSIMTVNGAIDPKNAGIFLPHENIIPPFA